MFGLTLDLFWLSLAAIGMIGRQARPYLAVLFTMWMVQEAAQVQAVGIFGEFIMIAADLIACTTLYLIWRRNRETWAAVVVVMFAPSLLVQSCYWLAASLGHRFDWLFFWASAFIFTVQMVSLASPGGRRLGTAFVCRLRSWRPFRGWNLRCGHFDRAFAAQPVRTYRLTLEQGPDA